MTRSELIEALQVAEANQGELLFLADVDEACAESLGSVARTLVPILGDAVFFDLCHQGEFSRRAGAAHASEWPMLGAAIEAHATSTAWHTFVEHVVMTGLPMVDPSRTVAFSVGTNAMGFMVVPLAARGKIFGILGVIRVDESFSRAELELARKVAGRVARTLDLRR